MINLLKKQKINISTYIAKVVEEPKK
jgi:hypothetical protein